MTATGAVTGTCWGNWVLSEALDHRKGAHAALPGVLSLGMPAALRWESPAGSA